MCAKPLPSGQSAQDCCVINVDSKGACMLKKSKLQLLDVCISSKQRHDMVMQFVAIDDTLEPECLNYSLNYSLNCSPDDYWGCCAGCDLHIG